MLTQLRMFLVERALGALWIATREQIERSVVPGNGGIAFIGDSITHLGKWELIFPDLPIRNFGIAGERSEHLLIRLEPLIGLQPSKVFVLIGTNDIGIGLGVDQIASNIDTLLNRLGQALPGCRLYLQSVMPRQRKHFARVVALNQKLLAIAARHGATFIDLCPMLDDGTGQLRAEMTGDSLHLNGAGYLAWREQLKPHLAS